MTAISVSLLSADDQGTASVERGVCRAVQTVQVLFVWLLVGAAGCASMRPAAAGDERLGCVFYVDGAGGGGLVSWRHGVVEGLRQAGFAGSIREFVWQTGLGLVADQLSSVEFKRGQARTLAREIREYRHAHPYTPIHLIALSAGTAVALYAVEELPQGCDVDDVVLLASSLSASYDPSAALRHVRGRVHVFTSPRDAVLRCLVPLAGTADRKFCGDRVAGLSGFDFARATDAEALRPYGKMVTVSWTSDFNDAGNCGGHTDAVRTSFVAQHVAPCLGQQRSVLAARTMRWPEYGLGR